MNPLVITGLFSAAQSLIERFFPDPEKQAEAQRALLQMQQNGELALLASETDLAKLQIQTNIEEARSANLFVSGWRPAVGWTCAAAFAYSYILLPFAQFIVFTFGTAEMVAQLSEAPKLNLAEMLPILFGMLGLGSLRTVEKVKNVEGNRFKLISENITEDEPKSSLVRKGLKKVFSEGENATIAGVSKVLKAFNLRIVITRE